MELLHPAQLRPVSARRSLRGEQGNISAAFIEANPSLYSPGATSQNSEQRRPYAGCSPDGSCAFGSVGLIADNNSSTYNALQVAFSRQFTHNLAFLASYWWSKSLDYVSSLNLSGSAATLVAGENDLAQNPHGQSAPKLTNLFVNGWQPNTIINLSSGTPFTVYDSANVSLQGSAPEITGFYSSRPNLISNPNAGAHTPNQWVSRSAFQQLNPIANAGQFGNEGRNLVRGPGIETVDLSLFKYFALGESARLQFRAEFFNTLNHANLGLPENDLQSPALF